MKMNVMKTVQQALVMLLSPSQVAWGQGRLTKEEKRAQKLLDKRVKMANGGSDLSRFWNTTASCVIE